MNRKIQLASICALLVTAFSSIPDCVQAAAVHVPGDYKTIQAGIDAAGISDTVLIASGAYLENLIVQEKNNITLLGEDGPENTFVDGDEKDRVIFVTNCEGVIRVSGLTFQRGYTQENGGGIQIILTKISISNCHFIDNEAVNEGGGVSIMQSSSYALYDCVIERNRSVASGGLNLIGGEGEVHHNLIARNVGAVSVAIQFTGCDFHDNIVVRNESSTFGAVGYLFPIVGRVVGNTIAYNTGSAGSGALLVQSGKATVERNIVCNNFDLFGLNIESPDRMIHVGLNNVWGNDSGYYTGQEPGSTNFQEDPVFCDPATDDYSLGAASPCLPRDGRELVGALGKGCD